MANSDRIPSYQFLSTVNVGSFVSFKLRAKSNNMPTNYASWRLQMLSLIESHDLLGHVDGSIRLPEAAAAGNDGTDNREGYVMWRSDMVVRGWILGAISEPGLVDFAARFRTAREVWMELKTKLGGSDFHVDSQTQEGPPTVTPQSLQPHGDQEKDFFNVQLPLHKAALEGNWEAAQQILELDPGASRTWIDNDNVLTPLEVAVGTGKAIHFVENLVALMPDDESVALRNDKGSTALHIAAAVGNRAAAIILVNRLPFLCYIPDMYGDFPIQYAAQYAKKEVLQYLITVTNTYMEINPYAGLPGLRLLLCIIDAEFFDVALYLVDKHPHLAGLRLRNGHSALAHIIGKSVLLNRSHFNFFIPSLTKIRIAEKKSRAKKEALNLVKILCKQIRALGNFPEARDIYEDAVLKAAELGVREVVEIIMDIFPLSLYAYRLPSGQYIFHRAVENRCEDVFNLIYQMSDHQHLFSNIEDAERNNLLHSAGKLAPPHKLNEISGAALQMQRELQWFKAVESLVHPYSRERQNRNGKTPQMVFTEEHKTLKEEGEKWMKDTANSCTIAAALIATVMFAAAITVPGGNQSAGNPVFLEVPSFTIFAISDAASLFTSIISLLMFLSILTSRYAEEDFLYRLPKRLIYGFGSLFISITSMMVSFSVTLYLVFGRKQTWVLATVLAVALFPITAFVLMQSPLLVDLISATHGPGIFGKKSARPFY